MKINIENSIYEVKTTSKFNKELKKAAKQNKDIEKLIVIVEQLANKKPLDSKYNDHSLRDDKYYNGCRECNITPDWLLIYKIQDEKLILLLFATGSHSELFGK